MKIFCPECGAKKEFFEKRPKFCEDCGYAFGVASVKKVIAVAEDEVDDEEEVTEDLDYNIPKIDAEELGINKRGFITVGQAMASPSQESNFNRNSGGKRALSQLQEAVRSKRENNI